MHTKTERKIETYRQKQRPRNGQKDTDRLTDSQLKDIQYTKYTDRQAD